MTLSIRWLEPQHVAVKLIERDNSERISHSAGWYSFASCAPWSAHRRESLSLPTRACRGCAARRSSAIPATIGPDHLLVELERRAGYWSLFARCCVGGRKQQREHGNCNCCGKTGATSEREKPRDDTT